LKKKNRDFVFLSKGRVKKSTTNWTPPSLPDKP
jgi:hypothetical protein